MRNILNKIDLFSYKMQFNFRGNLSYNSLLSCLASIFLYFFLIYMLYYFSIDMIKKKNPRISYIETEFKEAIDISLDDFINKININIEGKLVLNTSNLNSTTPKTNNITNSFTNNETGKNNSMYSTDEEFNLYEYLIKRNLTLDDLIKVQIKIYKRIENLSQEEETEYEHKIIMLNLTNSDDFNITGKNTFAYQKVISNDETRYSSYQIIQTLIDSEKQNENILLMDSNRNLSDFIFNVTKSTIIRFGFRINYEFLKNLNLVINFDRIDRNFSMLDSRIDLEYDKFFVPFNKEYKLESHSQPKLINEASFLYNYYLARDDVGFIFEDYQDHDVIILRSFLNSGTIDIDRDGDYLNFMKINFHSIKKNYFRIHKKLQNVFADLSGIFSSIILMGNVLVSVFNKKFFYCDAINFLFTMDDSEKHSKLCLDVSHKLFENKEKFSDLKNKQSNSLNLPSAEPTDSSGRKLNALNNICNECEKKKLACLTRTDYGEGKITEIEKEKEKINYPNLVKSKRKTSQNSLGNEDISMHDSDKINNLVFWKNKERMIHYQNSYNTFQENTEDFFNIINQNKIQGEITQAFRKINNSEGNAKTLELSIRANLQDVSLSDKSFLSSSKNNSQDKNSNNNKIECISNSQTNRKFKDSDLNLKKRIDQIIIMTAEKRRVNIKYDGENSKQLLKFSYSEYLKMTFCCSKNKSQGLKQKEELFVTAADKVFKYLDVFNYFSIYEEIEKIKKIIFNEHESVLFNFSNKRSYSEAFNAELEDKLLASIKYYKMRKDLCKDDTFKKILDNCVKEIKELI